MRAHPRASGRPVPPVTAKTATTVGSSIAALCLISVLLSGCAPAPEAGAPSPSISASDDSAEAVELNEEIASLPEVDRLSYFDEAIAAGRTGEARKTAPVTARPASAGEVVVSLLEGDGIETVSPPAEEGDMVVRSDCGSNTVTEILVGAEKFPSRYGSPQSDADDDGYQRYLPSGEPMNYVLVSGEDGAFWFEAPWGEPMIARPGDAIVQNQGDPDDVYRIYGPAFDCTYEVSRPAR